MIVAPLVLKLLKSVVYCMTLCLSFDSVSWIPTFISYRVGMVIFLKVETRSHFEGCDPGCVGSFCRIQGPITQAIESRLETRINSIRVK